MTVYECIAQEQAVFVLAEENLLFEDYSTYSICNSRHTLPLHLNDVFVPFRTVIVTLIFVYAEIKLSPMLYDCLIQAREQHMILVKSST